MPMMIFVNLPVTDLARATSFYESIGAVRNPRCSDETASRMVFSETIHVMLLTHAKFARFAPRPIADAHATCQVLNCLSAESREAVDAMIDRAAGAGGTADPAPKIDMGVMYGRSFADPDGHVWEVMWMDPKLAEGDCPADTSA